MNFSIAMMFAAALLLIGCDKAPQDGRKEQQITCINNLKQMGLAFRIWAGGHGDRLPFNTSTNAGGTLELCAGGQRRL